MEHYVITAELDRRTLTEAHTDDILDRLADYHPALTTSSGGTIQAIITVPGDSYAQAVRTALAVIAEPVLSVHAITEQLRDKRAGWHQVDEVLSVTEAAAALGISRQAVLGQIRRGTLPATKVGFCHGIPRGAVEALLKR